MSLHFARIGLLVFIVTTFTTAQAFDFGAALTPTNKSQPQLVIYDVQPADFPLDKLESLVLESIQEFASGVLATRNLTLNAPPDYPGKIAFNELKIMSISIPIPVCDGAVSIINAKESGMAQYGEGTVSMACIFSYKGGYRVDYYAKYSDTSSTSSAAGLGAMLGKSIGRAIGLGDSSKFIFQTMDTMEKKLANAGATVKLVYTQPSIANKDVQPDELIQKMALAKNAQVQREQAMSARKDLASIGLNANSQDQFFDAIRRGDKIAVDLFIQAGSIDLSDPDGAGNTPLQVAKKPDIADMLRQAGAK